MKFQARNIAPHPPLPNTVRLEQKVGNCVLGFPSGSACGAGLRVSEGYTMLARGQQAGIAKLPSTISELPQLLHPSTQPRWLNSEA